MSAFDYMKMYNLFGIYDVARWIINNMSIPHPDDNILMFTLKLNNGGMSLFISSKLSRKY